MAAARKNSDGKLGAVREPSTLSFDSITKIQPIPGGAAINPGTAVELRRVVYGSTVHSFTHEWRQGCFMFQDTESPLAFGLHVERCGARGLIMCVQAHLLRRLIFKYSTREEILRRNVLKPQEWQREVALVEAFCDILWKAGEDKRACVCLPQEVEDFEPPPKYKADGITEKLHLFEFSNYGDLYEFVKKHVDHFITPDRCGFILLLYSLVLSRTIPKIHLDYGEGTCELLTTEEQVTRTLLNLLITGRAVQYLHNGDIIYDEDGRVLRNPQRGILERSEIGLLFWHKEELDRQRTQVGSMLKTPKRPVWVSQVNGQLGVLFSTNPELVSDWRTEHHFSLHYYTGLPSQGKDVILTVDTRFGRASNTKTLHGKREERKCIPHMDQCIMTKWAGAQVDWNGHLPFV